MHLFSADPDVDLIEELVPNGTVLYLGFFTELPDSDGLGGVESSIARIPLDEFGWVSLPNGNRANQFDIHILCPIDVRIYGEGLFDSAVGGTLLAFGETQLVQGAARSLPLRQDLHYIGHLPLSMQISFSGNDSIFDVYTESYRRPLNQLYPTGHAWSQDLASHWQQLLLAQSIEFSRVDYRARLFTSELFPLTAEETLDQWEADLGLPEFGETALTLAERQQAAFEKYAQTFDPTEAFFIAIAEDLGYTGVFIRLEGNPFTVGSVIGDTLRGGPWLFTWTLVTNESTADDDLLMFRIRKYTPQHTLVLFELGP